mmetsp:Transcript_11415/g.29413  ORF Transcript_11415/g.29413 Transcript_11415/m.29413 type:complete len:267 (+) Transcript_11415:652-1452(+)
MLDLPHQQPGVGHVAAVPPPLLQGLLLADARSPYAVSPLPRGLVDRAAWQVPRAGEPRKAHGHGVCGHGLLAQPAAWPWRRAGHAGVAAPDVRRFWVAVARCANGRQQRATAGVAAAAAAAAAAAPRAGSAGHRRAPEVVARRAAGATQTAKHSGERPAGTTVRRCGATTSLGIELGGAVAGADAVGAVQAREGLRAPGPLGPRGSGPRRRRRLPRLGQKRLLAATGQGENGRHPERDAGLPVARVACSRRRCRCRRATAGRAVGG